MENETELSEYQNYVIKGLIEQERQALGRELSLSEQHRIRDDYLTATPPPVAKTCVPTQPAN